MKKKWNKICPLLFFILLPSINIWCQTPANDDNWTTKITSKSDEFNSTTIHERWVRLSEDMGDYQFLQNYCIFTGSILRLKYYKSAGPYYYTAGIKTWQFNYPYGYYEISAKLPYGKGFWPTFWLWNGTEDWYEEIDILEPNGCQYQYADKNVVGYWYKLNPPSMDPSSNAKAINCIVGDLPNMSQAYHKYGLEWLPDRIVFYFDDIAIAGDVEDSRIPSHELQVVLSLQIGPSQGGCLPDESVSFPQYMDVDYFRYYEMKENGCSSSVSVSGTNYSSYDYSVKKTITISNLTIPDGALSKPSFRATDYIHISSNFTVPSGRELNLIPTNCN